MSVKKGQTKTRHSRTDLDKESKAIIKAAAERKREERPPNHGVHYDGNRKKASGLIFLCCSFSVPILHFLHQFQHEKVLKIPLQ